MKNATNVPRKPAAMQAGYTVAIQREMRKMEHIKLDKFKEAVDLYRRRLQGGTEPMQALPPHAL